MPMITLADWLAQQRIARRIDEPLADLLGRAADACIEIAGLVGRGALAGVLGGAGTENVQGESQKKLDVVSNALLVQALSSAAGVRALASEEIEEPLTVGPGGYLALFDPLDGSSNIDVNVSIGTILSVLRAPANSAGGVADFLQPGGKQAAAGFAVYGPATMLVLTVGAGSHAFTLDRAAGVFCLTGENLRIPEETSEFAINASNARRWEAPVRRYIEECLAGTSGPRKRDFNMRWVASMVADVFRVLSRGGIFMYPRDDKNRAGRLRLMYEANPMAFVVEQAGGAATEGERRILDMAPEGLHQRTAVVLGSRSEVERVRDYHRG